MASGNYSSIDSDVVLQGGCRCGNITYTSSTLPIDIGNCHCRACQQISGSPFLTLADFPTSSIQWISVDTKGRPMCGDSAMARYTSNPFAERGFCAKCGSTMMIWYKCDPARYHIAAASIDEQSVKGELPKMRNHIFLRDKAQWEVIGDDGLDRYEGFSEDGFDKRIDQWVKAHPAEVERWKMANIEKLDTGNKWPN